MRNATDEEMVEGKEREGGGQVQRPLQRPTPPLNRGHKAYSAYIHASRRCLRVKRRDTRATAGTVDVRAT